MQIEQNQEIVKDQRLFYPRPCWLRFVPMILVMGTIFFLSNRPGDTLSLPDVPNIDKVLHAGIYGLLALTTLFAIGKKTTLARPCQVSFLVVVFCMFYGITDEYHQSFIPGRTPSIWDLCADTIGALLMVILWSRFLLQNDKKRAIGYSRR